jgi:hypothetical protein
VANHINKGEVDLCILLSISRILSPLIKGLVEQQVAMNLLRGSLATLGDPPNPLGKGEQEFSPTHIVFLVLFSASAENPLTP